MAWHGLQYNTVSIKKRWFIALRCRPGPAPHPGFASRTSRRPGARSAERPCVSNYFIDPCGWAAAGARKIRVYASRPHEPGVIESIRLNAAEGLPTESGQLSRGLVTAIGCPVCHVPDHAQPRPVPKCSLMFTRVQPASRSPAVVVPSVDGPAKCPSSWWAGLAYIPASPVSEAI